MTEVAVPAESDLYQQYPDLTRLARVLRRSQGGFSLFFAECNLPVLRQQLATALLERLESPPVRVDLSPTDIDTETIDEIIARQVNGSPPDAPVFLFGLEQLLPSLSSDKLRATVQQLNWRRSSLARLQRPLLIWLPRYALDLLAEQTPDFYDWYSGVFSFAVQTEQREQSEAGAFQDLWSETGVHAAEHMSSSEKKRWLGTLQELLHEHPEMDKSRAVLLENLGYLLDSMGDREKALSYYQQSLTIKQEIGDKSGEGTTLNNISQIYDSRGDFDTALNYLKQSLQIQQDIGDKSGEGTTLNNISQIYDSRGDLDTALNYLKQSLQIQQEIGDKSGEGTTLNNISQIFKIHGDFDTALDYLKQSLQIQREIGDKSGEGITLNNISQIFKTRGDLNAALNYLKQSLQIQQEVGNKFGEGTTLNNISQIYDSRGDFDTALNYLKHSLQIQQEIGNVAGLCATLFNIGHIHQQNAETEEAMIIWVEVYRLAKKMNLAQALNALENLAPQLGIKDGLEGWERLSNSTFPEDLSIPLLDS